MLSPQVSEPPRHLLSVSAPSFTHQAKGASPQEGIPEVLPLGAQGNVQCPREKLLRGDLPSLEGLASIRVDLTGHTPTRSGNPADPTSGFPGCRSTRSSTKGGKGERFKVSSIKGGRFSLGEGIKVG